VYAMAAYLAEGKDARELVVRERMTDQCGICEDTSLEGVSEVDYSPCELCGSAFHSSCVAEQFAEVPGVDREGEAHVLCHSCVTERFTEVCLLRLLWSKAEVAKQVLLVEGVVSMLDPENGRFWESARAESLKGGDLVKKGQVERVVVSPFKTKQQPGRAKLGKKVERAVKVVSRGPVKEEELPAKGKKPSKTGLACGPESSGVLRGEGEVFAGLTATNVTQMIQDQLARHEVASRSGVSLGVLGFGGLIAPGEGSLGARDGYTKGGCGWPLVAGGFRHS
jgi:hypothetical protein